MNKKILLFLGSGVSLKSGLPNTNAITDELLKKKWHYSSELKFYPGEEPNEYLKDKDITPYIQKFLNILKELSELYYNEKKDLNYEDLFYICQQIHLYKIDEIFNPLIGPFIKEIQYKLVGFDIYQSSSLKYDNHNDSIDLNYLSEKAMLLIQSVVYHSLSKSEPQGFNLILQLIDKRIPLNIATLNHDLLIEKLFIQKNIEYCDGFGELDGDLRYYEPSVYDNDARINLFKLHGSIDWFRINGIKNNIPKSYCMALKENYEDLYDNAGNHITVLNAVPNFLTGSYNKLMDYNFGIYNSILHKFHNHLYHTETIIISGYGFNDKGINGLIEEWLFSDIDNKIILLHEKPEDLRIYKKWVRYYNLKKENRLILINKWLSDVKYEEIEQYII